MQATNMDLVMSFLPLTLLMLPVIIGAFYLAPKMGANPWVWGILLIIPIVNIVAGYFFLFRVAGAILDRLNALMPLATAKKFD